MVSRKAQHCCVLVVINSQQCKVHLSSITLKGAQYSYSSYSKYACTYKVHQ